jgi:hypothetical protein
VEKPKGKDLLLERLRKKRQQKDSDDEEDEGDDTVFGDNDDNRFQENDCANEKVFLLFRKYKY